MTRKAPRAPPPAPGKRRPGRRPTHPLPPQRLQTTLPPDVLAYLHAHGAAQTITRLVRAAMQAQTPGE